MYSQFKLFLFITVINLNSRPSNGLNQVKQSLVIILDVTASMKDEFDRLIIYSEELLDTVNDWPRNSIENYILVQFGDEAINRDTIQPFETPNYEIFKNHLKNVILYYNNDVSCTASCYRGLQQGLELANNDSVFLVFTDAGTQKKELLPMIKVLAQQKRVTFYFTLTKGCASESTANDYHELVSIYNGDVYNVDHTNLGKHFKFLAQILTGPPVTPSVEVVVDSTMNEFILTVTGLNAIITIFDPKQKYVSSTRYRMLTDSQTIKMVSVPNPMPGRYTIEIVSETPYTGQVQTKSELQFKYGFAVHEPKSIVQTAYAPLEGYNTYLAISPSNTSLIENLDFVKLITTNRHYQYRLWRKASQGGDIFLTQSIKIPSESFKIEIHGRDLMNYRILRLISPSIGSILPASPSVNVESKITVQEGQPILLSCFVYSFVNVTIIWSKIGLNSPLKFIEFTQSDALNYTIDDSRISDSGEYVCTAENSVGKAESISTVTVKQPQLSVHTLLKSLDTEVGTQSLVLGCDVSPNTKYVKVSWLFNGKPLLASGFQYNQSNLILFNIERNFAGLYTCVGQKGAERKWDSIQLNVMYPPRILNLINSNTSRVIDNRAPLKMAKNSTLQITCEHESYPQPTIQWLSPTGKIISNKISLKLVNKIESGEYSCQVENKLGKDERKFEIFVASHISELEQSTTEIWSTTTTTFGPRIIEIQVIDDMQTRTLAPMEQEIYLNNQTKITIVCKTEGNPEPLTQWRQNEITLSPTNTLTISSPQLNISGVYECITENQINISSHSITVNRVVKPLVIQNYNRSIELIEGLSFTMGCPIKPGNYNVTWTLNNQSMDNFKLSDDSIYIDSVNVNINGILSCLASNTAGSANATFMLEILRPPYELVVKSSSTKSLNINDAYEIKCSAKGRPKPKIYWTKDEIYFKQGNSISFDKFQASDIGKYSCIADNNLGSITNKTFVIDLFSGPYDIKAESSIGLDPIVNQSYHIKCSAKGNPQPDIIWKKDGNIIARGESYVIPIFQQKHSGEYICMAKNDFGMSTTKLNLHFTHPNNSDDRPTQTTIILILILLLFLIFLFLLLVYLFNRNK